MHRPAPSAMTAALLVALATAPTPAADAPGQAQAALAAGDGRTAAAILEAALAEAPAGRRADLLADLRRAYELAAHQADANGQAREARAYRDDLLILSRKPSRTAAPPFPEPPAIAKTEEQTQATAPNPAPPLDHEPRPPAPLPQPKPVPLPEVARPDPVRPLPAPTEEATAPVTDPLAAADASFRDGHYDEAGRAYAALAKARKLPEARRDHWAYCRMAGVVQRINARPKSAAEWAGLDTEVERIRALSPRNWFGQYLRNLVARRPVAAPAGDGAKLVLRGAAPEETGGTARRRPAAEGVKLASVANRGQAQGLIPAPKPPANPTEGDWQVRLTTNFRIRHFNPALAERVAVAAEAAREAQVRRWIGKEPSPVWSPKCDIYVYPDAATYARMTGQPADSPGFSQMGQNGGRIVSRRVNLRADHPSVDTAVLPHEVTHVVLADLFPTRPIPRWADEGMAVLAEPASERRNRAKDLADPLATGRLFPMKGLVAMDSPEDQHWGLYYAQSVSLTRFLVARGGHAQFIRFLQAAERNGFEPELRKVYKIDGCGDLHARWLAFAKAEPTEESAIADEPLRR